MIFSSIGPQSVELSGIARLGRSTSYGVHYPNISVCLRILATADESELLLAKHLLIPLRKAPIIRHPFRKVALAKVGHRKRILCRITSHVVFSNIEE